MAQPPSLPSLVSGVASIANVEAVEQAAERARQARADNTVRAYKSDWDDWTTACARLGMDQTPTSATVAVYIDQLARLGAKVSTIQRRISALNAHLRLKQMEPLSVRDEPLASVLRGIRREIGAPPEGARPVELDLLKKLIASTPEGLAGIRDRALLLLGFAGAFRRSELAGFDWTREGNGQGFIEPVAQGVRVILRRSKTNQLGDHEEVAICYGAAEATCPVRALDAWREAVEEREGEARGPLFRAVDRHGRLSRDHLDGGSVSRIVKRAAARAVEAHGATPEEVEAALERISGHSLRSGLVTTAFDKGLNAEDIMRQTRHRDVKTLLGYRRHATAFVANVSGRIGL